MADADNKRAVRAFWEQGAAGEFWAAGESETARLDAEFHARFAFEPNVAPFADFESGAGKRVLEIGVGMGADHVRWAQAHPALLAGIDITDRAIRYTQRRFELADLKSALVNGDAEALPYRDGVFDIVYSWGVIHHSPDTARAAREIHRVLKPGGVAKVMIYHLRSMTGYMLWLRYGLMRGRPLTGLREIYAKHLESPGTKAYTVDEARSLFAPFSAVDIKVVLNYGDLLQSHVGRRHRGPLLTLAKAIWPRPLIRALFRNHGLYLLITARK